MSNAFNTGEFAIATPKQFNKEELLSLNVLVGMAIIDSNRSGNKEMITEYSALQTKIQKLIWSK